MDKIIHLSITMSTNTLELLVAPCLSMHEDCDITHIIQVQSRKTYAHQVGTRICQNLSALAL